MEVFTGIDSIFYIKYDGLWCPISCEVSSPMSETVEMINTTTRDNAGWKTEKPTLQAYSISIDSVEKKDNYNEIVSYRKVRKFKRDRIKIEWKRETITNYLVDSGFGYITEISDGNTVGEEITFNFTISGFGKPIENELPDIYSIYSDEITYNFSYDHTPENMTNDGDWFLSNLIYNNYYNAYGIVYDCNLKFQIKSVPVKGFLANNTTRQIYAVDDIISYCDKDELVYFPNGFDNDLGVIGNYIETFSYRIIDANGRFGKLTTHTFNMTDIASPSIDLSVSISWLDDSSAPKSGNLANINVKQASLVFDPLDPIISEEWQLFDGTNWNFYKTKTTDSESIELSVMENKIRLKVETTFSEIAYSNILTYTKATSSTVYITDIEAPYVGQPGYVRYKLHVEDEAFVGYANLRGEKNNMRNAICNNNHAGSMAMPQAFQSGDVKNQSTAVSIPVGVYNCYIEVIGIRNDYMTEAIFDASVNYGYVADFDDAITSTVDVQLIIDAG